MFAASGGTTSSEFIVFPHSPTPLQLGQRVAANSGDFGDGAAAALDTEPLTPRKQGAGAGPSRGPVPLHVCGAETRQASFDGNEKRRHQRRTAPGASAARSQLERPHRRKAAGARLRCRARLVIDGVATATLGIVHAGKPPKSTAGPHPLATWAVTLFPIRQDRSSCVLVRCHQTRRNLQPFRQGLILCPLQSSVGRPFST
jgi:hypothetical protein